MKRVLVIGGSGTMGRYLCPLLAEKGYKVHAITGEIQKDREGIRYFFANAMEDETLKGFLRNGYDGVVDFMWYNKERPGQYESRYRLFLENTDHYFALSSYRVYADSKTPLTEKSPRLSETLPENSEWKCSEGYAQTKCKMEDLLHEAKERNWTILRPSVVYCPGRVPLLSWSKTEVLLRALSGKRIAVPEAALDKKATMVWGEDAAKMMAGLMGLKKAKGEIYNIATSESLTWGEILQFYHNTIGLEWECCSTEDFIRILCGDNPDEKKRKWANFILPHDRLCMRQVDNSKVLEATGLKQEDLMPIRKGLTLAMEGFLPAEFSRMDAFFQGGAK